MKLTTNCIFVFLLVLHGMQSSAHAEFLLDITGVSGAGEVTLNFGGSGSTALGSGTIRTNVANTFAIDDTTETFPGDSILNAAIEDIVFATSGGATITIGGNTETITGLFLDEDSSVSGDQDDLGIRVANELNYLAGDVSSWQGTTTVTGLDIDDLVQGDFVHVNPGTSFLFISESVFDFRLTIRAVPEPATASVLALLSIWVTTRRKRN